MSYPESEPRPREPFASQPGQSHILRSLSGSRRELGGRWAWVVGVATGLCAAPILVGCDTPSTHVIIDNDYPTSAKTPFVIYQALWANVSFTTPVTPGSSSEEMAALPASSQLAYAMIAPGWDPDASAPPSSFLVMQSKQPYELHLDTTLHIPVNDTSFDGNCEAGSPLSEDQVTFIANRIFPKGTGSYVYDPATCMTTWIDDGGAP